MAPLLFSLASPSGRVGIVSLAVHIGAPAGDHIGPPQILDQFLESLSQRRDVGIGVALSLRHERRTAYGQEFPCKLGVDNVDAKALISAHVPIMAETRKRPWEPLTDRAGSVVG